MTDCFFFFFTQTIQLPLTQTTPCGCCLQEVLYHSVFFFFLLRPLQIFFNCKGNTQLPGLYNWKHSVQVALATERSWRSMCYRKELLVLVMQCEGGQEPDISLRIKPWPFTLKEEKEHSDGWLSCLTLLCLCWMKYWMRYVLCCSFPFLFHSHMWTHIYTHSLAQMGVCWMMRLHTVLFF